MHDTDSAVLRPAFHLTPIRNWMNDPNGLVFHGGRWHAYFQYNPEGPDWGNMSWGHASSTDLRHWDEHPVALRHRAGEQVYSGSVVVSTVGSTDDSRGDDQDELTAYYTSVSDEGGQAQSRAISRDGGYTWERDAENPVLDRGTSAFRDPKIIRYTDAAGADRWILLAVEADDRQVLFYSSTDLRSWEHVSTFGPIGATGVVWECPDLVPLAVDGHDDDVRWVLLLSTNPADDDPDPDGSTMGYLVGRFDGTSFTTEAADFRRVDHGRDCYAGVTFDSAPEGAAVLLAWMSNWRYAAAIPSAPWRGAMSLPRRLSLRSVDGEPRLVQEPPAFVTEALRSAAPATVSGSPGRFTQTLSGHSLVELRWDPASTGPLRLALHGTGDALVEAVHEPASGTLRVTRSGSASDAVHADFPSTSTAPLDGSRPARMVLSLDGPLLEVFVDDGAATISNLVLLGTEPVELTLETERASPVSVAAVDLGTADISTPAELPTPAESAAPPTTDLHHSLV